jgi:4-hydroxy-tetrahydrodipicolinate reductase
MKTKIIINGACGKMGKEIANAVISDSDCILFGCIEQPMHPAIGKDYGETVNLNIKNIKISKSISELDYKDCVIIDFSWAKATMSLLEKLDSTKAFVVIGTTGFSDNEIKEITSFSKKIPILLSPNMSLGVNLLFVITELVAKKIYKEFDIEIIEAHHRYKKDSPSGTARMLGQIIASAMGTKYEDVVKNGRAGIVQERPSKEIGMHSVRAGDIIGDHTVLFAGIGERIELRHVAHSRATFARGAVLAAKWLFGKKAGLYSMKDVLDL